MQICISESQTERGLIEEIWLMLMHTLRGQCEAITDEPIVVFHKQQQFRETWKKVEDFTSFGERIKWRYAPLVMYT